MAARLAVRFLVGWKIGRGVVVRQSRKLWESWWNDFVIFPLVWTKEILIGDNVIFQPPYIMQIISHHHLKLWWTFLVQKQVTSCLIVNHHSDKSGSYSIPPCASEMCISRRGKCWEVCLLLVSSPRLFRIITLFTLDICRKSLSSY